MNWLRKDKVSEGNSLVAPSNFAPFPGPILDFSSRQKIVFAEDKVNNTA